MLLGRKFKQLIASAIFRTQLRLFIFQVIDKGDHQGQALQRSLGCHSDSRLLGRLDQVFSKLVNRESYCFKTVPLRLQIVKHNWMLVAYTIKATSINFTTMLLGGGVSRTPIVFPLLTICAGFTSTFLPNSEGFPDRLSFTKESQPLKSKPKITFLCNYGSKYM